LSAPRRISAADTAVLKLATGLSLVAVAVLVAMMFRLFARHGGWARVGPGIVGLQAFSTVACVWLAITSFRSSGRLKQVDLSDTELRVSNLMREIAVPLGDVEAVNDGADSGYVGVVVTFARDTAFGRQIIFRPAESSESRPHPVVDEIRAAVARVKRA
jgi:hypothetical protein